MKKIIFLQIILFLTITTFSNSIFYIIHNKYNVNVARTKLIINTVDNVCKKLNIDSYIIYAIIEQESGFKNLNIHYDIDSNAVGYMQIHKNAFDYVKMLNPKFRKYKYHDLVYFPSVNIEIGIYYLYYIYKYWALSNHDIWYAVSIYNGNLTKYSIYENKIYKKYLYFHK